MNQKRFNSAKYIREASQMSPCPKCSGSGCRHCKDTGTAAGYTSHQRFMKLFDAGIIFIDGNDYVGKASDGSEVIVGVLGEETQMELYLNSHPTPDTW